MSRSRFVICLAVCLAACVSIAARAVNFVVSGFREIERSAAAFVWAVIETALRSSPSIAYAGPASPHALRHEAGTSRRAADRHI